MLYQKFRMKMHIYTRIQSCLKDQFQQRKFASRKATTITWVFLKGHMLYKLSSTSNCLYREEDSSIYSFGGLVSIYSRAPSAFSIYLTKYGIWSSFLLYLLLTVLVNFSSFNFQPRNYFLYSKYLINSLFQLSKSRNPFNIKMIWYMKN
jgi:hypothetical protein